MVKQTKPGVIVCQVHAGDAGVPGSIETGLKQNKTKHEPATAPGELVVSLGKVVKMPTEPLVWERWSQGGYPDSESTEEEVTLLENRHLMLREQQGSSVETSRNCIPALRECW